jgi:hypothetical protein
LEEIRMPETQKKTRLAMERVEKWNACHPEGTPVTRYALMDPLRGGAATKTRSAAFVMGGHSPMVLVDGVSGGVHLDSVVPIPNAATVAGAATRRWSYEGAIVFGLNDDGTGIALDDPAHAPLVAAAPDLLEACQFILKYDGKKIGSVGEGLLKIAIAKATEEEAAHGS